MQQVIFSTFATESVSFKQASAIRLMDNDILREKLQDVVRQTPIYPTDFIDSLLNDIDRAKQSRAALKEAILPATDIIGNRKDQLFAIRGCRNAPDARVFDLLIEVAQSEVYDEKVRVASIEALGWYNYSCKAQDIAARLLNLKESPSKAIAREAEKSIKRLAPDVIFFFAIP